VRSKKEIAVNNPEQINSHLVDVVSLDEQGPQPADELTEIQNAELEQVSGGGDGTAMGVA
jgi:hypothetical protein